MTPLLILGRDGMGADATEADFDAWVSFVCDHIDDACGFEVDVDYRHRREVQSDVIVRAGDDETIRVIWEAKQALWDRWCAGERADATRLCALCGGGGTVIEKGAGIGGLALERPCGCPAGKGKKV